jgi:hypothetical protein
MKEGDRFPIGWRGVLSLPWQIVKGWWTGEPIGFALRVSPYLSCVKQSQWTKRIEEGKACYIFTVYARLNRRGFGWRDAPMFDMFEYMQKIDNTYKVEDYRHEYERVIRPAFEVVVKKDRRGDNSA